MVKNLLAYSGDLDLIPELERSPGEGHGNPPQYSCLENPMDQRSLVGYSPWGRTKFNTAEHTCTHTLQQITTNSVA